MVGVVVAAEKPGGGERGCGSGGGGGEGAVVEGMVAAVPVAEEDVVLCDKIHKP